MSGNDPRRRLRWEYKGGAFVIATVPSAVAGEVMTALTRAQFLAQLAEAERIASFLLEAEGRGE
jgi:hypothetical protein